MLMNFEELLCKEFGDDQALAGQLPWRAIHLA